MLKHNYDCGMGMISNEGHAELWASTNTLMNNLDMCPVFVWGGWVGGGVHTHVLR